MPLLQTILHYHVHSNIGFSFISIKTTHKIDLFKAKISDVSGMFQVGGFHLLRPGSEHIVSNFSTEFSNEKEKFQT